MFRSNRTFLIILLTFLMAGMAFFVCVSAKAAEVESLKYVKEVRFVFGKTEEEAASWLKENKYEPILADSIVLRYGNGEMPEGWRSRLAHFPYARKV